jgi:histone arginine demethylase JMJD6
VNFIDQIDRHAALSRESFENDYLKPLRPVVITDAIAQWPALGKWTPQFFKDNYGHLEIHVDGQTLTLGDLVDQVEVSTEENPAPYLRNQAIEEWPPELMADITPMPDCTRQNWLESRFFPSGAKLAAIEAYIGGRGATFPTLHYDGLHTHAFLMQLHGEKEYIAFGPDQTPYMYPHSVGGNTSQIDNLLDPDFDVHPLFERAEGVRFKLHPGETLFIPSGWWHTARILSPSVTVSINGLNRTNYQDFRRDYCASISKGSRIKALVAWAGLAIANATHLFEEYGAFVLPFV